MTNAPTPSAAEKVVAEWRDAMEGVPDGPWLYRPKEHDDWGIIRGPDDAEGLSSFVFQVRSGFQSEDELAAHRSAKTDPWGAMAQFIARCSPSGISGLLALIESQRAELAEVRESLHYANGTADLAIRHRDVAEARATALEAEIATLVKALADPVVVHRNMLAGSIAKPSTMNIAHLYPEVQQMRQALIATLKHFRHPTSAEHETRDKVMAALSHFDDPPLTPMAQALSRSSTEVKNDE